MKRSKSTPLHLAIRDPAELEKLLRAKEDELFIHQSKHTLFESPESPCGLLQCAVLGGNEASISLLLEKGADINERDDTGRTALIHACSEGHESIVRMLLDFGADVSVCDDDRQNCAHWAYSMDHVSLGDWLMKRYGSVLSVKDRKGKFPFDWRSHEDLSMEERGDRAMAEASGIDDTDNAQLTAFIINGKETNFAAGSGMTATRWLKENSEGLMQESGKASVHLKAR